ncbi:MFS transporter [Nocardioides immobilis]|uniref:MFS transporter n=1 Tax=Nocardioides immobilis TaxID=2049295 RepID=A0A417XTY7_9ACTN|nr:MFS transporter [Nocardioides immobilis]
MLVFPAAVAVHAMLPVLALGSIAFGIRADIQLSVADIGLAFSSFFLCSAVFTSAGGWLAVRSRTSTVARAGTLCSSLLFVGLGAAPNRPVFLMLCLGAGVVNGLLTPSLNILITKIVPVNRWGLAFGLKAAAAPAAATFAALGAYCVAELGVDWRSLFWSCAVAGGLLFTLSWRLGRDEVETDRREQRQRMRPQRSLVILGFGGLCGSIGTSVLTPFTVEGLIDAGQTPSSAAILLAVGGWVGIVSRVAVGVLSDVWPEPLCHLRATSAMLVAGSLSMVVLGAGGPFGLLLSATLVAFGLGWSWPGLLHHAALATHAHNAAVATSYMQTGTFLGALIGPLCFGFVAQQVSFPAAWFISATSALLGAAFMMATVRELKPHHPPNDSPPLTLTV